MGSLRTHLYADGLIRSNRADITPYFTEGNGLILLSNVSLYGALTREAQRGGIHERVRGPTGSGQKGCSEGAHRYFGLNIHGCLLELPEEQEVCVALSLLETTVEKRP